MSKMTLPKRVLSYLEQHPGATVREITDALNYAPYDAVRTALVRQRERRLVVSGGSGTDLLWYPANQAPNGMTVLERVRPVEEESWTPGPWVHPIRARALGLPLRRVA